uniref:Uncharacterized protein n=1 Tax=Rhizophora mucronata TaxID=61149 RepID=A0A2P2P3A0_RHIMU
MNCFSSGKFNSFNDYKNRKQKSKFIHTSNKLEKDIHFEAKC